MTRNFLMTMMIAGLLLEGGGPTFAAGAREGQADQTRQDRESQELGLPVPGTADDQESTHKQRDVGKAHEPEADAQVTLGGAQYFVEGSIATIEDRYYFVRKQDTGEQIRLIVNRDTNLDCAGMPNPRSGKAAKTDRMTSERVSPKEQAPGASQQQLRQGQRKDETARGSGFQVGPCNFRVGDQVKAEVDDNGKVTTLKYLDGD